ncbi:TPA: hypothetical protein ACGIK9_003436 [Acinetobacter baumannii]|uniref:hypothetical protein n=1 Tax=Acinetobacter baumannii TaxID=470 RepID=UPI00338FD823
MSKDDDLLERIRPDPRSTTWGAAPSYSDLDPNTKRRYTLLLLNIGGVFRWVTIFNLVIFLTGLVIFLYVKNEFEITIFDDGTEALCVLEPKSGEIKQHVYK